MQSHKIHVHNNWRNPLEIVQSSQYRTDYRGYISERKTDYIRCFGNHTVDNLSIYNHFPGQQDYETYQIYQEEQQVFRYN